MSISADISGRPTAQTIRADILQYLDDTPEGDDNLLDYGLNSVNLMTLMTRWEAQGLSADFNALARMPTLNAILAALADQLAPTQDASHG